MLSVRPLLARLVRARAVQFLAVGAVLALLAPKETDDRAVVIDSPRVYEALRAAEARAGHPLRPADKNAAIRELVDEEVLAREARRLGLVLDDAVVRARLAERMRASLARTMPRPVVSRSELDSAIAGEIARSPERVRLAVWFVSKDRPDAVAAADALERAVAEDRERARGAGDRPPIPDGAFWTEEALARVCGPTAARAAMDVPVGTSTKALASAWGHYVFVPLERRRATADEVRSAALEAVVRGKTEADLTKAIRRARKDYRIDVRMPAGEPPPELDGDSAEPSANAGGVN